MTQRFSQGRRGRQEGFLVRGGRQGQGRQALALGARHQQFPVMPIQGEGRTPLLLGPDLQEGLLPEQGLSPGDFQIEQRRALVLPLPRTAHERAQRVARRVDPVGVVELGIAIMEVPGQGRKVLELVPRP